jgi:hypothetical protein
MAGPRPRPGSGLCNLICAAALDSGAAVAGADMIVSPETEMACRLQRKAALWLEVQYALRSR